MTISRKKSCAQCRRAKAGCSLTVPRCSRCMERRLQCDYAGHVPRTAPYSYSGDLSVRHRTAAVEAVPIAGTAASPGHEEDDVPLDQSSSIQPYGMQLCLPPEPAAPHPLGGLDWSSFNIADVGMSTAWGLNELSLVPSASPPWHFPGGPIVMSQAPGLVEGDGGDEDSLRRGNATGSGTHSDLLLHDKTSVALGMRRSMTASAFLATKVMMGQIESYPMMMTTGHALPPFIHSRCALDGGLSYDCAARGAHQCLPQTLSICASLVHMFQTKTAASARFAWESIYAEMSRLYREHQGYDDEDLLQAIQATSVYVILQAQDRESIERNNVWWMIRVLGDMASKLHVRSDYNTFIDTTDYALTRKEWVHRESARRTMCLIYLIEMLLEVIIGSGDTRCCQSFTLAPLPCIRDLWEAPSTSDWNKRYKSYLRSRSSNKILTLQDFRPSQNLASEQLVCQNSPGDLASDVVRWCERMDQFGIIIWLATSLVKYDGSLLASQRPM